MALRNCLTFRYWGFALMLLAWGFVPQSHAQQTHSRQAAATLVLRHGAIHTMDAVHPHATALAVVGDRIVAVGTDAEVAPWIGPRTKVLNAGGKLVLPGFNDGHVHFVQGAFQLSSVDLRDAPSQAEFARRICAKAATLAPGEWITGGDWDDQKWTPALLPTRQLIDPCTARHPVFVTRYDGHMGVANSLALHLAKIDASTPTPAGGVIVQDASGQPTGILKDAAQPLVEAVIPTPTDAQMRRAIRVALRHAAGLGVTTLQDMAYPQALRVYQELLDAGQLTSRLYCRLPLGMWQTVAGVGIRNHFGGPMLTIGSMKGFADGSLGSTTAYFFQPYTDDPTTRGILSDEMNPPAAMYARMLGADQAGLQLSVHAIGDAANSLILDFFTKIAATDGRRDRRFRIEHAQHLAPTDFARFAQLGVIASVQPYHAIDDGRWLEKRIGPVRARTSYAFRTLLNHGVRLAFGTDWTVAPLNPMLGIYAAVTRETLDGKHPEGWFPDQKLTVQEAVYAYTVGSAYAAFEEHERGTLAPGLLADFVILDHDIFHLPPDAIKDVHVERTVMGGRTVFRLGDYPVAYGK